MALLLDITGDAIPADGEPLSDFYLDSKGQLGLANERLWKIVTQLVTALNLLNERVSTLQKDQEATGETTDALELQTSAFEGRLRECESACQQALVQAATARLGPTSPLPGAGDSRSHSAMGNADQVLADLEELAGKHEALAEKFETADRSAKEVGQRLSKRLNENESLLQKHQSALDGEVANHFGQNDQSIQGLQLELETIREARKEDNEKKADKSEMSDLTKQIFFMRQDISQEQAMLSKARVQFDKLDALVIMIEENKQGMQELWELVRKEILELRQWASQGLHEIRDDLRLKMNAAAAIEDIDRLRIEVRSIGPILSEATTRVAIDVKQKAEKLDVIRIQDTVAELTKHSTRTGQLLIGKKCISCDRVASAVDTTDLGHVELQRVRQQEELLKEVEHAIATRDWPLSSRAEQRNTSPIRDGGLMKYVAIHVGSPRSVGPGSPATGPNCFEVRHDSGAGGENHVLVATPGSRPSTCPESAQRNRNCIGMSARAPPREMPPIVRMSPRRARNPSISAAVRSSSGNFANKPIGRNLMGSGAGAGYKRLSTSPEVSSPARGASPQGMYPDDRQKDTLSPHSSLDDF